MSGIRTCHNLEITRLIHPLKIGIIELKVVIVHIQLDYLHAGSINSLIKRLFAQTHYFAAVRFNLGFEL